MKQDLAIVEALQTSGARVRELPSSALNPIPLSLLKVWCSPQSHSSCQCNPSIRVVNQCWEANINLVIEMN